MASPPNRPARRRVWPGLVVALLAISSAAMATTISGRVAVWSYFRDDTVDHVQFVPLLSLNIRQIAQSNFSVETALRGFADFRNGSGESEAVRVHRALLIYAPHRGKWEVKAGQQWLSEGIGRGNVAGLWARYMPKSKWSLVAYGGSRLPQSISLDESIPNEGAAAGLNIKYKFGTRQLGLSYFYVAKSGDVLFQGAGLDYVCQPQRSLSMRARLHVNLEQSRIETGELAAVWDAQEHLRFSAILRNHAPRIFEDSFFATFLEDASTTSARVTAKWTSCSSVYVSGSGITVFAEDDVLYKTRIGIGVPEAEIGYTHWLSAGEGDMDGFYAQAVKSVTPCLTLMAGFDYSRGSNSEIRPNTESQSEWLGASFTPIRSFSAGLRGEHLKNSHRSEDWRVLVSLSSQFTVTR